MSTYGKMLLAKQRFFVPTDFEMQYTFFNLQKNQCFDSKIQPYGLIFLPTGRGEVMEHTLYLVKFVLLFTIKRKMSI